jgi:Nuclease A inhibitor-like protein
MADDAASAIQHASAGLLYPSESDAPFDLIRWEAGKGEPTADTVAKGTGKSRPVQEVPVADFFATLADTDDAAKFQALEEAMKKFLVNLRVFRVGRSPKVDIYVFGRATSGEWLGLHTTSVET